MENTINKSIGSRAVQGIAAGFHLTDNELWSLFFDSGLDYLDQLRNRMSNHSVFKAQFGELIDAVKMPTPRETFRKIMLSHFFWEWWSSQLWRVCYNHTDKSVDEMHIRLMFNTSLIPQSTLYKIFNDDNQQKNQTRHSSISAGIKHRTEQVC